MVATELYGFICDRFVMFHPLVYFKPPIVLYLFILQKVQNQAIRMILRGLTLNALLSDKKRGCQVHSRVGCISAQGDL